jgi:hypothetical protein
MIQKQCFVKESPFHNFSALLSPSPGGSRLTGFQLKLMIALAGLLFTSLVGLPIHAQDRRKDLGDFNLTLVGDNNIVTLATARQNNPRFMALVDEIRKGDAAFNNLETTFPGPDDYPGGAPRSENIFSDPSLLKELQWIGFNLYGTANNHSLDYGIPGMLNTIQVLKQAGAVYAGTGVDLGHARAPGYLSTAHGRVALISTASTFPQDSPAGQTRRASWAKSVTLRCALSCQRNRFRSTAQTKRESEADGCSGRLRINSDAKFCLSAIWALG